MAYACKLLFCPLNLYAGQVVFSSSFSGALVARGAGNGREKSRDGRKVYFAASTLTQTQSGQRSNLPPVLGQIRDWARSASLCAASPATAAATALPRAVSQAMFTRILMPLTRVSLVVASLLKLNQKEIGFMLMRIASQQRVCFRRYCVSTHARGRCAERCAARPAPRLAAAGRRNASKDLCLVSEQCEGARADRPVSTRPRRATRQCDTIPRF